ncbi:MAG: UDP-N-acetylglucosamine 1-carboxyvinyltransferase [Firmicutes bacterium]|nr:UDP-N-acetylglucosamine 1-carboxyvinyltransferase [Bacillota bacterium]
MENLLISGGTRLHGKVRIHGAKNAALPILAATLLAGGPVTLREIPELEDVRTMLDLLKHLGVKVKRLAPCRYRLDPVGFAGWDAPYELVRKMRASFLVLGPILSLHGRTRVSLPGGCAIGSRPIDLHLKGLQALGAEISMGYGFIEAKSKQLRGNHIFLDYPSVGATENLLMAASLARGETVIVGCAQEPEVVDLANFLNILGAKISGAGTDRITVKGVQALGGGVEYTIIPDRIEAGTYLAAAAAAGGNLQLTNVEPEHLRPTLAKLVEAGATIQETDRGLFVERDGPLNSFDITTLPYPGFPTDLQPIFTALASLSQGVSLIRETVFENRFRYVDELLRMGASIKVEGNVALVYGVSTLYGTRVKAHDLRGGAALVVAALAAQGTTTLTCLHHLDRGYADLELNLQRVGAKIQRVPAEDTGIVTA